MGLFATLLAFPVTLPVKGVLMLANKLADIAEREENAPEAIKRALVALETRFEAGEIDEETFEREEMVLLQRLNPPRPPLEDTDAERGAG